MHSKLISRRSFLASAAAFAAITAAGGLTACGGSGGSSASGPGSVRIGTMPTEDILPMWAAERDGLFGEAGVQAQVVVFDSAQNLSAALAAGEVDLAMTDIMRAVKLCESGTDVRMEWVTLGTDASQGRFGVLAAPDSEWNSLEDVASYLENESVGEDWGFGVAANTVPEYVFDSLCEQAGLDPSAVPVQEVPSLPDRYSLVASGKLPGGAFPGSMLALGEASGLRVIADDTAGNNISQSVMVARMAYVQDEGGQALVEGVAKAWDLAAQAINDDPESYRSLLVEKANLNSAIADSYPISTYPLATADDGSLAVPAGSYVEPVVQWMAAKGYSGGSVSYNEDGSFETA